MSFKTAQDAFETALHFADTDNNPALQHLIEGMIDLTKALKMNANTNETHLRAIESKINSMR